MHASFKPFILELGDPYTSVHDVTLVKNTESLQSMNVTSMNGMAYIWVCHNTDITAGVISNL